MAILGNRDGSYISDAQPLIDKNPTFQIIARFDEFVQDGEEFIQNGEVIKFTYIYTVKASDLPLYAQGVGGGGGGGGGACGRGPGWPKGGGGAGGSGSVSENLFPLNLRAGSKIIIKLGQPGVPGNGGPPDNFGSVGGRGGDTIVKDVGSVLFNAPGATGGGGGEFQRGGEGWFGGNPGDITPPQSPLGYYFTEGGSGARSGVANPGQRPYTPIGGAGGYAGQNGGGGGGASLKGNGGNGGNFATNYVDDTGKTRYGIGQNGQLGSGGGGGAGGGPGTSDDGGRGGFGGYGYFWLYKRLS